jgi:hypothetical protein
MLRKLELGIDLEVIFLKAQLDLLILPETREEYLQKGNSRLK